VSDGELKALYQHASCFVFPSLYEGFGLPPLEAMACGCPVIASTAPAVREVCGDAALYFDPHSSEELAARLREFFTDASVRPRLVAAAETRTREYDWARNAAMHLQLLRELLGRAPSIAAAAANPVPSSTPDTGRAGSSVR
jgi:glycosyltransferase involved in cell wall biosynthesis